MKKFVFVICAVMAALLLTFPVFADEFTFADSAEIVSVEQAPAEQEEPVVNETHEEITEEEPWTHQAAAWVKSNLESIVVILTAIYAVFPKWGGLAVLIKSVKDVKYFFDDKKNEKSIYNILSGSLDTVSKFMNQYADKIDKLEQFIPYLSDLKTFMDGSDEEKKKLIAAMEAETKSLALIAKQCNRLVEIAPNATAKDKELFNEEWVRDVKSLNAAIDAVKEVGNDGKA